MGELTGINLAMQTPMHTDGSIDYARWEELIDDYIDAGVHGLVLGAGTGQRRRSHDSPGIPRHGLQGVERLRPQYRVCSYRRCERLYLGRRQLYAPRKRAAI